MRACTPRSEPYALSLTVARNGMPSLRLESSDGSMRTFHSLYDPEKEARRTVEAFRFAGEGVIVVLGLGLGYHVAELARRFEKAAILVVEAAPEIHELAEKHGRVPPPTDRIRFLLGMPEKQVLREITNWQLERGMAPLCVFVLSPAVAAFPDYYRPLVAALDRAVSFRLWDRLKYPKFQEDSTKVGLIDFGYFLSREIEHAVGRLGHRLLRVPIRKGEDGGTIVSRLIDRILAFKPDFFLTINHLGFDEDGVLTSFFRSIEMPVASWYVDSPRLIVGAHDKNVSPYTALFVWDRGYVNEMKSAGFENVVYLPLATDEQIFRPLPRNARREKVPGCEVGFVGHSNVGPLRERMEKVAEPLHRLVDRLAEEVLRGCHPLEDPSAFLSTDEAHQLSSLGSREKVALEAAVLWKATVQYRLSCVKKLSGFDACIYGDEGWELLLNNSCRLHPQVDYYNELPGIYNRCRIHLNATNRQMGKAVNQRVFDVPACGGFLLTDEQESLEELFEIGREVVTFRHPEEIPELARFYLGHPAERDAVARRGRQRVLAEHTYRHRLADLVQRMKATYGCRCERLCKG